MSHHLINYNHLCLRERLLDGEAPGADGAEILAFGLEVKRDKAESPFFLHIQGLNHPTAVWARAWCYLPCQNSFIFITDEYQAHLFSDLALLFRIERSISSRLRSIVDRKFAGFGGML